MYTLYISIEVGSVGQLLIAYFFMNVDILMNGKKVLLIFHKGCHTFTRHAMQCLHIKERNPRFILDRKSVNWCSLFVQLEMSCDWYYWSITRNKQKISLIKKHCNKDFMKQNYRKLWASFNYKYSLLLPAVIMSNKFQTGMYHVA